MRNCLVQKSFVCEVHSTYPRPQITDPTVEQQHTHYSPSNHLHHDNAQQTTMDLLRAYFHCAPATVSRRLWVRAQKEWVSIIDNITTWILMSWPMPVPIAYVSRILIISLNSKALGGRRLPPSPLTLSYIFVYIITF